MHKAASRQRCLLILHFSDSTKTSLLQYVKLDFGVPLVAIPTIKGLALQPRLILSEGQIKAPTRGVNVGTRIRPREHVW